MSFEQDIVIIWAICVVDSLEQTKEQNNGNDAKYEASFRHCYPASIDSISLNPDSIITVKRRVAQAEAGQ